MNNSIKFLIFKQNNDKRLDIFLSNKLTDFTRSHIKKLIKKKYVRINDKVIVSPSKKVKTNDHIIVNSYKDDEKKLIPNKIQLNIVYEDKDLLIVNKPKGMIVHPGAGNFTNTLANALAFKYEKNLSNINGNLRPGIVHRIDKDTSGLLVVAKNNSSHAKLGTQFSEHSITRKYQCLIWGVIRPLQGRIETLISRDRKNRQLMTVTNIKGKKAITNYKTLKVFAIKDIPKISLIECDLETGRTHQIRVHLKYKGTSRIGDEQYGKKNPTFKKVNKVFLENLSKIKGQALHAKTIGFRHPSKGKWVEFNSNLPKDFKIMLNFLNNLVS
ncbi:MAG: RluA family pseudouridine synthase [Pseudomonadota bacterium]|nr:RluA family pseudouridine synthase [Pseudomonadota bacterium]